ncbi:MAG: hypothetical protein U9N32_07110 [Spirochaetota bacterium]|nr:hypothetical protein [Spirochaetota bacterium]
MRKTDSRRLIKALFISIVLHIIVFIGMNFVNWFPESNTEDKYAPLTVNIESSPVVRSSRIEDPDSKEEVNEELSKPSVIETPDIVENSVNKPVVKVTEASISDTAPDNNSNPYANPGSWDNPITPVSEPEPLEHGVEQTPYVPTGKNAVELEKTVIGDTNQSFDGSKEPSDDNAISVLSDNEFQGLEQAVNKDNDKSDSESLPKTESDSDLFTYRDVPVEFDNPGINRELLTNPPPAIPDDLPSDFPPEITYIIGFSLNSDGLIRVLSINPSSVYPRIDASIKKALRSWTFKESSGSEPVKGTITLIFKGK